LGVLAGAVEEVDGVDQQRVDRRAGERLAAGGDLLVAVHRRLPGPRVLVEDLNRAAVRFDAALDGLGRSAGGGDVGTDEHPARVASRRRPGGSASLRLPPAPCTSAARAPRSTTGSPPATPAARSCCASRTPTVSARPPRTSSRSSTRC